jgi:hypothetical protein
MRLSVIDNTHVSVQKNKQSMPSTSKICTNCGEELLTYDTKKLCSGACRQERNVRLQVTSRAYKNLK